MKVWEKDNPVNRAELQRDMGSHWTGLRWWSLFQLYQGTMEFDEYQKMVVDHPE